MRLLILHQYFRRPEEGGAIRSFYLLNGFVKRGFDVTIITSHNEPHKKVSNINGAKVIYLPVAYNNSFGLAKRLISFIKFFFKSYLELRKTPSDLVYAVSTPLTVGFLAYLNRKIRGKKFLFEVGDLWPAIPEQMGIIKNRFLISLAYKVEKSVVNNALLLISMSPDISRYYKKANDKVRIIEIPNFSDLSFFNPKRIGLSNLDKKLSDLSDKIICVYTGTFGLANDVNQILELARVSEKIGMNFHFILIGEGAQWNNIHVASQNHSNVTVLPFSNKEDMFAILKMSSFSIVCYAQYSLLGTGSPNKLFDSLAMGKIPIINVKGWMSDLFEKENCGLFWNLSDSKEVLIEMKDVFSDKSTYLEMSSNAMKVAKTKFDLEKNMDLLSEEIQSLNLK